jgi:hypothetical protein
LVPKGLSWRDISAVFYNLVNNDPALTHHSKRAFRNGALWTSAADLRAVSLIGILIFEIVLLVGQLVDRLSFPAYRAVFGILVCILIFVISFALSKAFTNKQMEIGNEQIEHILMHHPNSPSR